MAASAAVRFSGGSWGYSLPYSDEFSEHENLGSKSTLPVYARAPGTARVLGAACAAERRACEIKRQSTGIADGENKSAARCVAGGEGAAPVLRAVASARTTRVGVAALPLTSRQAGGRQQSGFGMGPDGSEVGVDSIRPGVHQRAAYSGHSADVRRVACNQDDNLFVTLDERACHIWTTEGGAGAVMVRELGFPRGSYLTAIIFVPKLQLFLAACLEGAIHIYGPDMEPRAQLTLPKAAAGAIVDMVFNPETDELITAGGCGT